MKSRLLFALLVAVVLMTIAQAQPTAKSPRSEITVLPAADAVNPGTPTLLQFRWQKGQVLSYKLKNVTKVTENYRADGEQQFGSKLDLVKRYRVVEVDAQGVATIEYSVTAMRNEQTRPNGETLLFDSADPDKSTPGLKEQLAKFVGPTLAVLRIDPTGQVVEVKQGPKDRYGDEPPFTVVLPNQKLLRLQHWLRSYEVVLNPPLGTGEKFKASQEYTLIQITDGKAKIAIATPPIGGATAEAHEKIRLIPKEAKGHVIFDETAGRVVEVHLSVDRTVEKHQGPGSSYRYESTHVETLVAE